MAFGNDVFHAVGFFAALFAAMFIQIGTNFCNDYFDFRQGADTADRQGPARAVQSGWISERAMLVATAITFGLAALMALILFFRGGWPMAVIGILSILCGVWYTAGRYSLAYLGIGDLFVLVFFGPVAVGGTYYVQALALPLEVVIAGIGPGLISMGLLAINNLRDADQDREAGKKTLAVRFGRGACRAEYMLALGLAVILAFSLSAALPERRWVGLAGLILLPALPVFKVVARGSDGKTLNPLLGKTAKLLLLYALLFSVGWNLT